MKKKFQNKYQIYLNLKNLTLYKYQKINKNFWIIFNRQIVEKLKFRSFNLVNGKNNKIMSQTSKKEAK